MDSYLDIHVRPQAELSSTVLMSSLFGEIHKALVSRSSNTTGVSFPKADVHLGGTLRLHDEETVLVQLIESAWLKRASDYYRVDAPRPVPEHDQWLSVRRKQPSISAAKLRRMMARGNLKQEEAERLLSQKQKLDHPYVQLTSTSTGQKFRLFVEQTKCERPKFKPEFNSYGLGGVVPLF